MSYYALKHLHMSFALLSGVLFTLRGAFMLGGARWPAWRPVRVSSYLIDTILLTSAVALAIWSAQYPLVQHWLTLKVLAVIAYIGAGVVAMRARSRTARTLAYVGALLLFVIILKLAFTKQLY